MGTGKHTYKGLTLIEVMISVLIALVIVIGVIGYMYACAYNARAADVRATATAGPACHGSLEGGRSGPGFIRPGPVSQPRHFS